MSYQENRAIVFFTTILITTCLYGLFVFHTYHETILSNPNDFKFWGKIFLIMIPVSIVANIIMAIILTIIHKIVTNEDIPTFSDERDKLIELKSVRVAHWVFIFGFLLSMGSQAMGMQPWVMFISLVISGFAAACADEATKFYLYHKGF
jgi:hypothetical protein